MFFIFLFIHSLNYSAPAICKVLFLGVVENKIINNLMPILKKKMCNMEILKVVTSKMQMTKEDKKSRH